MGMRSILLFSAKAKPPFREVNNLHADVNNPSGDQKSIARKLGGGVSTQPETAGLRSAGSEGCLFHYGLGRIVRDF